MPRRRILSAWLPSWPITRLHRERNGTRDSDPIATVETVRGSRRLAAVCEASAALGLYPGQPLTAARAICPHLSVTEADPEADRAALQALASWCERYSPLAAADPPDGLWLDISGCEHLFGGEAALAESLAGRLRRQGAVCRIAIAGTTGAAWALARSAGKAPVIAASGEEAAALEPLPVAYLRIAEPIVAGLHRLGLRKIRDLRRLPRSELTVRFGPSLLLRLDQALGVADEVVSWLHRQQPWETRLGFAEPISCPEDLARTLALLSERLCRRLSAERLGGHRFACRFYRVDEAVPQIDIATALAVSDAGYLAKLLAAKLETVDPGFGIEVAALAAEDVAPCRPEQSELLGKNAKQSAKLAALVDTLGNRLACSRLWGVAPQQSHVPERAVTRVAPLDPHRSDWPKEPFQVRPIRLLHRPEPIEVTAPVPDDPPLAFRWRGALHRVRAASGPERIAAEWWRRAAAEASENRRSETDLFRDYYRVEDMAGSRFWLFRAGLREGGRWYLHGLFG